MTTPAKYNVTKETHLLTEDIVAEETRKIAGTKTMTNPQGKRKIDENHVVRTADKRGDNAYIYLNTCINQVVI